jgi:hypothetical protein
MFAALAARAVFVCAISLLFAPETKLTKSALYFWQSMGTQNSNFFIDP